MGHREKSKNGCVGKGENRIMLRLLVSHWTSVPLLVCWVLRLILIRCQVKFKCNWRRNFLVEVGVSNLDVYRCSSIAITLGRVLPYQIMEQYTFNRLCPTPISSRWFSVESRIDDSRGGCSIVKGSLRLLFSCDTFVATYACCHFHAFLVLIHQFEFAWYIILLPPISF